MFYFRINRLFISDNKEKPKYFLFGPDRAEVKLISFVTTGNDDLPDLTAFIATNDPEKKEKLLKDAIKAVVASRILTEIENVKDNHIMNFGKTGYVLYQSKTIPADFNWQFIAYESDGDIRSNAEIVEKILGDKEFDTFTGNLISLLAKASNPALEAGIAIAKYALTVIAKIAKENKDDLIGLLYTSLNRKEHYPHGIRNKEEVSDLTNNMRIDYSIFGFEKADNPELN